MRFSRLARLRTGQASKTKHTQSPSPIPQPAIHSQHPNPNSEKGTTADIKVTRRQGEAAGTLCLGARQGGLSSGWVGGGGGEGPILQAP